MRYLPHTPADRRAMLAAIGVPSVDSLYRDVPASVPQKPRFDLPDHQSELAVERALTALAEKNVAAGAVPSFLGAGAYRHHVPAAVDHLIQRGEFLTSYTPYQPEVSQGTLQYLYEFQTLVADLFGMEIANASMYDGATATAEAALMARRVTRRNRIVLSGGLHPQYRDVTTTSFKHLEASVVALPPDPSGGERAVDAIDGETACVVVQYPDMFGRIADLTALASACHAKGALLVVAVSEVVALGLIEPPGAMGADIVAAEGRSLGNALNFGGPYLGLFATRERFVRQMPGRVVGETVDVDGRRGWVLTLSTREQHIRREKATSNICTNSGLCALAFTIHAALLGADGLARLAALNHAHAVRLAERLARIAGVRVVTEAFFNEFTVVLPKPAVPVVEALAARGVLGGVPLARLYPEVPSFADRLLVAATETNTEADMDRFAALLAEVLQ
ncbi:MAG: aminomethyl-transferring glycine dehydrogenase subunit GcvPA [Alphaproteobacteria bacterium]|nr:aminomethyl-transferring glycine dehydrogenase subunit GcvPA [Alphaproteobacteria bacterium]